MKTPNLIRWFLILACLMSLICSGQTADTVYHVETIDGNEFIGTIVDQNDTEVKLKTEKLGMLTIKRSDIKHMQLVTGSKMNGQFWLDNPQSTRYFWQPNGYGIKKGEGYYQNVWIFGNQVSVGVTDNFTLGAGMIPLFLFNGAPTPIWVTPKLSIPVKKDKFNIGLGALAGTVLAGSDWGGGGSFGVVYGITTFGSRDKNISFGMGYGYAGGSWATRPTITASFLYRVGSKGYIVSENYIFEESGMISIGGRRLVKRVSIDFGLWMPVTGEGFFVAVPWLGIAVPFNKK